jgi:cyclophilin family peptidyl-prolyl cis-trans isomerase
MTAGVTFGQGGDKQVIRIETSLGTMVAELDAKKAPETVKNILQYIDDQFYDDTIFHRVIKDFMIQGGGFNSTGRKPTRDPITNEAKNGLKNKRGTLVMARTGDPHSATAQFFINHSDNSFLDYPGQDGWGYAVFGKLVDGLDVLDKIANVKTASGDAPVETVAIHKIVLVEE